MTVKELITYLQTVPEELTDRIPVYKAFYSDSGCLKRLPIDYGILQNGLKDEYLGPRIELT